MKAKVSGAKNARNGKFRYIHVYYVMMALLVLSVVTGIYDVLLPALAGARPFYHLAKFLDAFGYFYLYLHIYVHNLGLACLLPAVGLMAMYYEKKTQFRPLILNVLAFTSLIALYSGLIYMDIEVTRRMLIVFVFETEGMMIMTIGSYSFMHGMDFKERKTGRKLARMGFADTIEPIVQKIFPYFIVSALSFAAGAFFELRIIAGV
jgi:hypothetical protein